MLKTVAYMDQTLQADADFASHSAGRDYILLSTRNRELENALAARYGEAKPYLQESAGENQQTDHCERDLTAALVRDLEKENQTLRVTLGEERDKMAAKEARDRLRKMHTKRLERKPKDNGWSENPTGRDNETYARRSTAGTNSVSSSGSETQEDSTPTTSMRFSDWLRRHTAYQKGKGLRV